MNRPAGISVIAVLEWIACGFLVIVGLRLHLVVVAFGILLGVVAHGMWRLGRWARLATIVVAGLAILKGMVGLWTALGVFHHLEIGELIYDLLVIYISLIMIRYLLKPNIVQAFGAANTQADRLA